MPLVPGSNVKLDERFNSTTEWNLLGGGTLPLSENFGFSILGPCIPHYMTVSVGNMPRSQGATACLCCAKQTCGQWKLDMTFAETVKHVLILKPTNMELSARRLAWFTKWKTRLSRLCLRRNDRKSQRAKTLSGSSVVDITIYSNPWVHAQHLMRVLVFIYSSRDFICGLWI